MTQEEFNQKFITTKEVAEFVGVTVSAVWYAKERGQLPNAIEIQNSRACIWSRDQILPKLEIWRAWKNDRLSSKEG